MRARALTSLLLLAGCASDFTPRSVLEELRVLALVAEPAEIGFGETTTVTAHTWPAARAATGQWTFCPYSLGASVAYACIVPACEQPLTASGGTVTVAPAPLTLAFAQCAQALLGGTLPGGLPAAPPERFEGIVKYRVSDAAGAVSREAVLRLPVTYPGPPAARNANPVILSVRIGGQLQPPPAGEPLPRLTSGGKLQVSAVLDAPEAKPDGRLEDSVLSFFTTAGRFDYDRALGPSGSVELEGKELAAGNASTQEIWVVARDLRGGQAVAGPFEVEVQP